MNTGQGAELPFPIPVEFLRDGAFVMQLISLSFDGPDAWTRRESYICEVDFSGSFLPD